MWIHDSELVWRCFDIGASFIWAVSGALMAATRGYDLTGIYAVALVSSTGGGLLRDSLFLQQGPPTLVRSPVYIGVAGIAAILVWLSGRQAPILRPLARVGGLVDAVGLGGFAVVGMQLALRAKLSLPGVVLVGVVNAIGGSVVRSLLLYETPPVFRPGELTAVASLLGCFLHLGLTRGVGVDPRCSAVLTVLFVALLNTGSVRFGLRTRAARSFADTPHPIPDLGARGDAGRDTRRELPRGGAARPADQGANQDSG